jgi:hypothetical protein
MSTAAQILANQANAQSSTGPRTEEGKSCSSRNNFRHGLASGQIIVPGEDPAEFEALLAGMREEYQPATITEEVLVLCMAQHFWLGQRAICLQNGAFVNGDSPAKIALLMRYQTSNDRGYHHCVSQLLKIRAEKYRQEIGFESQKAKSAENARRQELHEARIRSLNAKSQLDEFDHEVRSTIEAPLPGHERLPFESVKGSITQAIRTLNHEIKEEKASKPAPFRAA